MKKKKIIIIFLVIAVLLVPVIIYLCQTKWIDTGRGYVQLSPDKYMGGAEGSSDYLPNSRVHYKVNVDKGGLHYDITDISGNTVAELNLYESKEGYLYLNNTEDKQLYDHCMALTDDTVASIEIISEYKVSNFKLFINAICSKLGIAVP